MHKFFKDEINEYDKSISITGEDVNHIKNVLRLSVGDEITVSDGRGRDYISAISSFGENEVIADIIDVCDSAAELPADITLFQGMPKGDKMEFIIQKAVELGVHDIVPVMMERTIVKLEDRKREKKTARYQLIAEAASKQSGRGIIPEVQSFKSFKEAIQLASSYDMVLVPYEDARGMSYARETIDFTAGLVGDGVNLSRAEGEGTGPAAKKKIAVFIGPEGGFAASEINMAKEIGARIISLGNRILRTETAGLTILSILMFNIDN
ncbi:MAG: 16S rRNA (uracil(1498)-N(3))-methyltransferase [Eubacterium sp.]|nr:16S rRNA (uracil(1498)-N(3))-methyltransferase [Eubacterium sp.]